jgi:hypothetical protein
MDYDARVTGKYAILLILPQITHIFFYLAYYKAGLSEAISSLIAISSFVVLHAVAYIVAVKISVAHKDDVDSEDMTTPNQYDVFLGRWKHALFYYGGLALIIIVVYVVHGGVTYYATKRSLETGGWIVMSGAGLVLIGSFLFGQFDFFDFLLEEGESTTYVTINENMPRPPIQTVKNVTKSFSQRAVYQNGKAKGVGAASAKMQSFYPVG